MSELHSAVPLLHDYLHESARRAPGKVALVCGDERRTYAQLEHESNALAHALRRAGVARGDRVVVFGDNTRETAVSFWGVLKADAVACMVSGHCKAEKLAYLLRDCRATALVADAQREPVVEAAGVHAPALRCTLVHGPITDERVQRLPGGRRWSETLVVERGDEPPPRRNIDLDLAAIIYTSGSSGQPKGVMLTHAAMRTAATSITTYLENTAHDVLLDVLPLSFDYGLYQMIMAFRVGARLVLERSFAYPAAVLGRAVAEGVTGFPGVPTVFATLCEQHNLERYDLSAVRYVTNTAAALPQKYIDLVRRAFPRARLYSMYGLTECKRVSYLPPEQLDVRPQSVGIAIPNTELWVVDEQGARLGPGEVGEIVVRGGTLMRGYWEKPEATARRLRPGPTPGEQLLFTGDLGRLDEEGYLYFVGRMDDLIKSRGEKVAPREVENVLLELPGVREAAVIGVPDELLGQAVKAFVAFEAGVQLEEGALRRHCQEHLEPFLVPKHFAVVAELPRTASGKITKTGLR